MTVTTDQTSDVVDSGTLREAYWRYRVDFAVSVVARTDTPDLMRVFSETRESPEDADHYAEFDAQVEDAHADLADASYLTWPEE